ncbi:MAG: hypothetical protein RLZZ155_574, partial [Bacteroidota bacterium]
MKYFPTNMKYTLLLLLIVGNIFVKAQIYFPPTVGNNWETRTPAELGWCEDQLPELSSFLESNNTKAFIVLKNG